MAEPCFASPEASAACGDLPPARRPTSRGCWSGLYHPSIPPSKAGKTRVRQALPGARSLPDAGNGTGLATPGGSVTDLDIRRRRAAYRAAHRGTKEMDWLVGRYADARLAAMVDPALAEFEALLTENDPELQKWLLEGLPIAGSKLGPLIAEIRNFHGLDGKV